MWFINILSILFFAITLCLSTSSHAENLHDNKDIYFFNHVPYINPRIISDLSTWISDGSDQIVAIDLLHSQHSNRYFLENEGNATKYNDFQYNYIGKLASGAYVLKTLESYPGGTMIAISLLVIGIVCDNDMNGDKRVLLKKYGELPLGDGWAGKIIINGNTILVKTDFTKGKDSSKLPDENSYVLAIHDNALVNRCYQGGSD